MMERERQGRGMKYGQGRCLVKEETYSDSLYRQSSSRELCHQTIRNSPHCQLITRRPNQHHTARRQPNRPIRYLALGKAQRTHSYQGCTQRTQPHRKQCPPTYPSRHQKPSAKDSDSVNSILPHGEVVCGRTGNTGLSEKVRRVVGECVSRKVLGRPDPTDEEGSTEVGSFETVDVARARVDL